MDQFQPLNLPSMNILITGITGLYGSFLAREFSHLGKIHGLRRSESPMDLLERLEFDITWHEGEVGDIDSLLEAMVGIDLVIHAAGKVSFSSKDDNLVYAINAQGTSNVVDAMLAQGVKKLVHVSSIAAIGRSAEILEVDESYKWADSPLNTHYAISKYRAELEAWRGQQEGLQVLVLNPSILLGKVAFHRSSTAIFDYVLQEHRFYPKGDINYIDVRDAAKIARLLVEKNAWGERFILNKESISYRLFLEKSAKIFSKKPPRIPLPSTFISVVVFILGILRLFGSSKSPLNKKTAMLSQQKIHFMNQKVNSLLNYHYFSLEESLEWAKPL